MQTEFDPHYGHLEISLTPSSTISNWPLIPADSTLKVLSDALPFSYGPFPSASASASSLAQQQPTSMLLSNGSLCIQCDLLTLGLRPLMVPTDLWTMFRLLSLAARPSMIQPISHLYLSYKHCVIPILNCRSRVLHTPFIAQRSARRSFCLEYSSYLVFLYF